MYPVWPIVDAKNVISILQQVTGDIDIETYALATAVAAATIAQLRLQPSLLHGKPITADTFAAESMRARRFGAYTSAVSLNRVRTSFFLHIYHESKHAGGSESLLFLREAISLAQMMNLHREIAYIGLPQDEQQIRRRVLWLLFITERGVCILHKLPVVLKTNISTPELDLDGEPQVLPAFLKLLNLFRLFDQSRMFDFIEDDDLEMYSISDEMRNLDKRSFKMLHDGLQDGSTLMDHISDVQKADLCVTRHWMRMILWKVSAKHHQFFPSQWADSPSFPILVAQELLDIVSKLPQAAIKAHGLGMELKLYGIANSLADAVINMAMLPMASFWNDESRPYDILARLHSFLSTFDGGENKELVDVLYKKMTEAQYKAGRAMWSTVHAPMKSRHLIETTSENQLVQEEPPLPGPDYIITIPDWSEGGDLNPAIHPTGTDWWMPGNLISPEEQADYPICLDDMLACGFAESCFSSVNNGYPAFSYDPQFTGGM
ncbi:hypothetical protein N7453_004948 [Penicillium expansum]|nr:hypothetical protein N7453_004948 [Penicillium expansum]